MAKSDEIKFTEDELKSLSDLRDTYAAIQNDFGAIKVRKVLLTQQLNTLEETEVQLEARYSETQTTEQELMKSLNEKYGPGNLDPQSGVFTPVSTP
jgi:chromosome segregation ATPase